eukprot:CAMPEP_0181327670 /NCGR_PEP_ID=MMETSP1101-20121128/22244_1 /TAXON_ID=46948 /ORGANISM="Rhodomonas abbreviata, Strain Caron Lab Isolate" /LENGTH=156 /DNA_ID=CAMNT_0023436383 /DNA_START=166 /DNA_END=633 /DNA_ORIENTATION=+
MASEIEILEQILRATDPFSVLAIPKEPVDISKLSSCYRRIALCVHPDKNDDPRAEQAFKLLNAAFETLGDEHQQQAALRRAGYTEARRAPRKRSRSPPSPRESERRKRDKESVWAEMHKFEIHLKATRLAQVMEKRKKAAERSEERKAARERRDAE